MSIVALDLSLRATAIAGCRRRPSPGGAPAVYGQLVDGGTLREDDPYGWEAPTRHGRILRKLWPHVTPNQTLVVKEDRIVVEATGKSALDIGGLHSVLDYGLRAMGVPIVKVNLTVLKRYATGKGNATKAEMLAAARKMLRPAFGADIDDHNTADAMWLLAMAMHHYWRPLWTLYSYQIEMVDRVAWPDWPPLTEQE